MKAKRAHGAAMASSSPSIVEADVFAAEVLVAKLIGTLAIVDRVR